MSSYVVSSKTKAKAKELGVTVKTSKNPKKKLDVFKDDKKVASVGASSYDDFHTYTKKKGKDFAKKRQSAYRSRHAKNIKKKGSAGFYANALLWS